MKETMSIMFSIPSWYVLLPAALLGLMGLWLWTRRRKEKVRPLQIAVLISLGIYLLCVLHLVFFPIDVNIGIYANRTPWYKAINFIPILTIDLKTFLLNIIMLIPFGMYLPFIMKSKGSTKKAAKLGFLLSASFELLQLIIRVTLGSGRSTDINDLLANTLGAVIGYLIVKRMFKVSPLNSILKQLLL
ncbi:VanZ family protein [Cytobacillus firmus]|uniref:VanZ family protein n=1 Tax=Cytobacillus firmus TaxID=1399 RepID=UPI0018CF58D4|nr:VanZ family protein [Cytobacillus firmus]MBG9586330.1 teicoplanin resistance protein VanZ [Cytobacillus firmus]